MCMGWAAFRRSCFFGAFHYTLSASSSLSPEGERLDGDDPFRTECSKVSHSLCIVQLWVCSSICVSYALSLAVLFVLCWSSTAGHVQTLRMVYIPSETSLEKTNLSFKE